MIKLISKLILSLSVLVFVPTLLLAQPERVSSFGPNGTHWPELIPTPFLYDRDVPNIINVAASWPAIKTALASVTDTKANAGTLILVAPGRLEGLGKSSVSEAVLSNLGSKNWLKRVTIAPRDGYGTVTWGGSTKIEKVYGVAFAGFITEDSIRFVGNSHSALAWMRIDGEQMGLYGAGGQTTEKVEIVEVVRNDFQVNPVPENTNGSYGNDNTDIYSGGTGAVIKNWRIVGSYFEPRFWRNPYVGGKPHTDTLQFAKGSGGTYSDMTFQDSALFTSNNCALQTGNLDGLLLDHTFIASDEVSKRRYPVLEGTNPDINDGWKSALNGSGKNFEAKDSIIVGKLAINDTDTSKIWNRVTNTLLVVDNAPTALNTPINGAWTVVTSIAANELKIGPANTSQRYSLSNWKSSVENNLGNYKTFTIKGQTHNLIHPNPAYLEEIWADPGATTKTKTPVFNLAAGTYNGAQTVSLSSSTSGAVIYYSTNGTTPTTGSLRYTAPIAVTQSITIKAIAVASGLENSNVASAAYVIENRAAAPVFSPNGGTFSEDQTVSITSATSGAIIRYTLDGSEPTTSSTLYSIPIIIDRTATLKAIAIRSGYDNSVVTTANFTIIDQGTYISSTSWTNVPLTEKTTQFEFHFDAVPSAINLDAVIGLSDGASTSFGDLAAAGRFFTNGKIDARNGGAYEAKNILSYVAGKSYHFKFVVYPATKKYDLTVTPAGEAAVVIAENYSFRNTDSKINNLGFVTATGGTHTISGIRFGDNTPVKTPKAPTNLRLTNITTNSPPVVNAGLDRQITLPTNSLTLTGSASDSNGSIVSRSWSKVSGGSATLSGENTDSLSLSNLVAGSYVFQFSATDNEGATSNDIVTVTVNSIAVNQPPLVSAGADRNILLSTTTLTLQGTASDSDGTIISRAWTKVSGGNATLVNANTAQVIISAYAVGEYVFRFTATDDDGAVSSDDLTITVSNTNNTGLASTTAYQNYPINNQLGSFTVIFDVTPSANNLNAITGLSSTAVTGQNHGDLATLIRLNANGIIDAFDGTSGNYREEATPDVNYVAGQTYRVEMQVNIGSQTYSVAVNGQSIAGNFRFRKAAANLNNIAYVNITNQTHLTNVISVNGQNPPPLQTLTIRKSGTGQGDVVGLQIAGGVDCGANCLRYSFPANTPINLIAAPSSSSVFTGWTGFCSGRSVCNSVLTGNQEVTANFSSGNVGSIYQESSGLLIMEAENTTSPLGSGTDRWQLYSIGDANYVSGAGNQKHLEFKGNDVSGGSPKAPLSYTFKINQGGYYQIHLRARKRLVDASGAVVAEDKNNDAYVRVTGDTYGTGPNAGNNHLDDAPLSLLINDTKIYGATATTWGWGEELDAGGESNKRRPIYNFNAGGTYTLTLSGRSIHYNVDRIVFRHLDLPINNAKDPYTLESSKATTGASAIPPVANAGNDLSINLPTSSVIINGSGTDADGTIASYRWTQVTGPNTAGLSGQTSATLTASGLIAGTYEFQLAVTDNQGNSHSDRVLLTVNSSTGSSVTGELRKWHKINFNFSGPNTSETATINPFTDYRLNLTLTHPASGKSYVIPGYFAADGNAGNTAASSGNIWRVHFAPDEIGIWNYTVSFRTGANVAVSEEVAAGTSAGYFDGQTGTITVVATNKSGRDFRGKGRLQYVGKHYLKFAETGDYFVKAGVDAPENLLAYADFDGDFKTDGQGDDYLKTYGSHIQDWRAGDPVWQGTKGKGLIGAVNYLASQGLNAFSFLTMNINGDDKNVFPYTSYSERLRMDVSKLDQWETVFEHGTKNGMYLHFKTQETENELLLDGGNVGTQRKLYYRELIARFGHNLALNWNLGEEINGASTAQKKAWAEYFYSHDPYKNHIVIHNTTSEWHDDLLGTGSRLTGFSAQMNAADFTDVFSTIKGLVDDSVAAGKPWVVALDEPGDSRYALRPDSTYLSAADNDGGESHTNARKHALWGGVLAGGAGVEFYFGYALAHSDLTCEDFRSRNSFWKYPKYLVQFFETYNLPLSEMKNQNALVSGAGNNANRVLAKLNDTYLVQLPAGGSVTLNLTGATGTFRVRWYNPRTGGSLVDRGTVNGGATVSLGTPPADANQDWVVLISR